MTRMSTRLDTIGGRRARLAVYRTALTRTDVGAALSFAVGGVHLVLAPGHAAAWWPAGVFFTAVGASQIGFGVALVRGARAAVVTAGLMLNMTVVAVYVTSRTAGLGPTHAAHTGGGYAVERADSVGVLDLTTTAVELVIVALLLTKLPARIRSWTVDALLLTGIAMWAARIFGFLD